MVTELKRFRKLPYVRVNAPNLTVLRVFRKDSVYPWQVWGPVDDQRTTAASIHPFSR